MAGVKNLIITHFWPEYDLGRLAREACAGFETEVIIAEENKNYDLIGRNLKCPELTEENQIN